MRQPLDKITKKFKHLRIGKPSPRPGFQIPGSATSVASEQVDEQLSELAEATQTSIAVQGEVEQPNSGSASEDKSSIWSQSMQRFAKEQSELYNMIADQIIEIWELDANTWDTWLNRQPEDKTNEWLRRCKAYLPRIKTLKSLATNLSNLDPHHLAPCVTTGVFVVIELFFESVDPLMRDNAIGILLKTSIIISKWVDWEADLRRMEKRARSQSVEKLKKQLPKLYFDGLMLVSSIYESGKTRVSRFKANLCSNMEEWDRAFQNLDNQNSACSQLKSLIELELQRTEANIAILDWIRIRDEDPEPAHQTVMERAGIDKSTSRAGNWFLETPVFTSWMYQIREEAEKPVLWLRGAMGTGKTTLICRVISHFEDSLVSGVRFVYYYCYSSKTGKGSESPRYETVLRALCYRLARNRDGSVAEPATDLYSQKKKDPDKPPTEKTWETLLKNLIASTSTPIVFAIDALDECKEQDDYIRLLNFLRGLPTSTSLHYLISSRPHVRVGDYFSDSVRIFDVVNPQAEGDMRRLVMGQIDSKKRDTRWQKSIFFEDSALCTRLESALLNSAGGMFRWVEIWLGVFFPKNRLPVRQHGYAERLLCELEDFRSLDTLSDGENDQSPGNEKEKAIKEAYEKLWDVYSSEQYKDHQVRVFQIITSALESLKPEQLLEAARFDPDNPGKSRELELDELEGLYCSFLKTNSEGYLDYEHLSAEVFVSEKKKEDFGDSNFCPESFLACCCLHCLGAIDGTYQTDCGFEEWRRKHSLYNYAARNWVSHFKQAGDRDKISKIASNVFKTGSKIFHTWFGIFYTWFGPYQYMTGPENFSITGLMAASYLGLETVVQILLKEPDVSIETKDNNGWTPLLWAVEYGHETVTELLLDEGANIEVMDENGWAPLLLAAMKGHQAVVGLLLNKGANVEVMDRYGQTPLSWAARNAHETIVKLLLGRGVNANIEATDENGQTPLSWAAMHGHTAVVRLLLDKGANTKATDKDGWTPLSLAAMNNYEAVVGLLLDEGADVKATDENGRAALSWAAKYGYETVVGLLLDKGADIEATDKYSQTPLLRAAKYGHKTVVGLLLDKGADIEATDKYGRTPLLWATMNMHEAVVELLLHKGSNTKVVDKISWAPLLWAAKYGHETIVELLLDKGADVKVTDKDGQTPLLWAAKYRHETVMELLLDKGADIEATDKYSQTPLLWAAKYGHKTVAGLLLEKGANVKAMDKNSQIPLLWAARNGYEAVVGLLLNKSANVKATDKYGRTPLSWAARNGHEAAVGLLLDKGASIEATDKDGRTPLSLAAEKGHEAVMQLLQSRRAQSS